MVILKWGDTNVILKKKNKFFLVITLIVLLLLPISVLAYDNPTTKTYSWDDGLSNSVFDIKTDKKVYDGFSRNIVYYKVTNLTSVKRDLDIQAFFSEETSINYFGEWKTLDHLEPVYSYSWVDDYHFNSKLDANFSGTCASHGWLDYNLTHCYYTTPRQVTIVTYQNNVYDDWKKSKAQAWQTKPSLVPSKMIWGGKLATINVGKNEVKYFVLDFSNKIGSKGEFYICGNEDCLDPWWSSDWNYRRKITVTNNFAGTLQDNNNNVKLQIGTELGAKARADCLDVRVVTVNGGVESELDSNFSYGSNCQSDANIYFDLNRPILNGGTDDDYYLYYGGSTTGRPESNIVLGSNDSYTVSYLPLDYTINNFAGSTNATKTANANFTITSNRRGAVLNQVEFDDYIDSQIQATGGDMTIEFWIDFADLAKQRFAGYINGGNYLQFIIEDSAPVGHLRVLVNSGAASHDLDSQVIPSGSDFRHIAYTCGAAGAKLYLDSNLIASNVDTDCPSDATNIAFLRVLNDGSIEGASASTVIDEIRITKGLQRTVFPQSWGGAGVDLNAEQPTFSLGSEEEETVLYLQTFNVLADHNASNLTGITMDCNVNAYDQAGKNSPFDVNMPDGCYELIFSRTGYDNNTQVMCVTGAAASHTYRLKDTTAPSVAATTVMDFTIYDSGLQKYFKGTGKIKGGAASDSGSGVNGTTCEVQYFAAGAWFAGDWNNAGTHCQSSAFTAVNTTEYIMNTRLDDVAGNLGTGTASDSYIGDTAAPTTSLSVLGGDFNYTTFRLTCTDVSSGCKNTWYKSDSNAWVVDTTTIDFNVFGIGTHTIYYNSSDNLDNNEGLHSYDFNVYGNLRFNFYNEVSAAALTDVNVTFNSVVYNTGTTYFVDVNLQGITPTTYTFTLSKTGYSTRYYEIDLNELMDLNKSFALILDTLDVDTGFTFYKPDGATLYANAFVEFWDMDTNYIIGRLKSSATATATFNLKANDSNYYMDMNNGEYLYIPVSLTIYYPRNEETLAQIDENWQVDITQNIYASYPELDGNQVVYLLPNTTVSHNLKVSDMNGNYFSRNYSKQYLGNPQTDTLQPYLVSTATGLLTTITVKNAVTGAVEDNIRIKIYKDIGGLGSTLVEEVVTDSKGQALTLLVLGDSYTFKVYNGTTLLKTYTITASSNTIFIYVYLTSGTTFVPASGYKVTFIPVGTGLTKITAGNATFTQTVYNLSGTSTTYTSQIIQNGTVLSTQSYTGTDANKTFTRTVAWTDINAGVVTSRLTITVGGFSYKYDQNYYVNNSFGSSYNLFTGLSSGLRSDMGCSSTGLCMPSLALALMISLIMALFISFKLGVLNPQSTGFILVFLMALFTYLTWVPLELTAAMVLILVAFVVNERRGQ